MQSNPRRVALVLILFIAAAATAITLVRHRELNRGASYAVAGLDPMTAGQAADQAYRLAPALLFVVYDAFGMTDEQAIHDRLAEVAAGDALRALYPERAGAMAGGGLTESDQTLHEMELVRLRADRDGETVTMDAEWNVIGTVGQTEHIHVRGNRYRAELTVEPVDGAWKITGFDLLNVSRENAGEVLEVAQ